MAEENPKQMCLDLSNAAFALFDELDEKGTNAPMESHAALAKLLAVMDCSEVLRVYYLTRSATSIAALTGKPPQTKGRKRGR